MHMGLCSPVILPRDGSNFKRVDTDLLRPSICSRCVWDAHALHWAVGLLSSLTEGIRPVNDVPDVISNAQLVMMICTRVTRLQHLFTVHSRLLPAIN